MENLTTGAKNVGVGRGTLGGTLTGEENVGVGDSAGAAMTTGSSNVAIGAEALKANTTGANNTAVGKGALQTVTTYGANVAVGTRALQNATSAEDNVAVGYQTATNLTTGDRNIFMGHNTQPSSATVDLEYIFGTTLTGKGQQTCFLGGNTGTFNEANESHFDTTSDSRIKKNIVNYDTGLSIVNQIQVRNFEYKTEDEIITDSPELKDVVKSAVVDKTGIQTGLIAQEAEAVLASTVVTNSTGIKSLHTDDIFWHMLNAIKELSAEVEALKAA